MFLNPGAEWDTTGWPGGNLLFDRFGGDPAAIVLGFSD
jgi:hypothetical protein